MKKKLLSAMLAFCMALTLLPSVAFAAGENDVEIPEGTPDYIGLQRGDEGATPSVPGGTGNVQVIDLDKNPNDGIMLLADAGDQTNNSTTPVERYTVLVLDCSGSMSGTPMTRVKEAAASFCRQVITAAGNNHIALVPFDTSVWTEKVVDFTTDLSALQSTISSLYSRGSTNMNAALEYADTLLQNVVVPGAVKNILLLSDGLPQHGTGLEPGHYDDLKGTYVDYCVPYANKCYETVTSGTMLNYNIYTFGFFHDIHDEYKVTCRRILHDLANSGFYEVEDVNDLQFVFGEVADDIVANTTDLDDVYIIPDYTMDDATAYEELATLLRDRLANNRNVTVKAPSSYDYQAAAAELAAEIERSVAADKQVDLLCYGTGGLIGSLLYSTYNTVSNKIDKFITVGTPFEGIPDLLRTNDTSNTQLIPTEAYRPVYHSSNSQWYTPDEYAAFWSGLPGGYDALKAIQAGYKALLNYQNAYFLSGKYNLTVSGVEFDETTHVSDVYVTVQGDGLVPHASSSMLGQIQARKFDSDRWERFAVSHWNMVNDSNCVNWIRGVLRNGKELVRGDNTQPDRYIVARIACPVDVVVDGVDSTDKKPGYSAALSSNRGKLYVVGSSEDPIKVLAMYEKDGDYTFQLKGKDANSKVEEFEVTYYDRFGNEYYTVEAKGIPVGTDPVTVTMPNAPTAATTINVNGNEVGTPGRYNDPNDEGDDPIDDVETPDTPAPTPNSYVFIPNVTGGTVVPSELNPSWGSQVILYAHPKAGYELTSLTVTDVRGWAVTTREISAGSYVFTMPDVRVTVNAVFTAVDGEEAPDTTVSVPAAGIGYGSYADIVYPMAPMAYNDVKTSDWFYSSVEYVYKRRMMSGKTDSAFDPASPAERHVTWTALARMSGRDTTGGATEYERGQIWAMNKGITDGSNPTGSLTREQLMTMLWRFKGSPVTPNDTLATYADNAKVSTWARDAVNWAVANGLLNGSYGNLNPQGETTRAETAAILMRFHQNIR